MAAHASPFLMFQNGVARAAIELYTSLFDDGEVISLEEYGSGGPGPEGTVYRAHFRVAGQEFFATDSFITHDFGFTPSFSIWVDVDSESQLRLLFDELAEGGQVLMPIGAYGFSSSFGWVDDRFGVSWQLNLE